MVDEFNPYWINIIDKEIIKFFNKFSPSLICSGRKPHNFGNEHNTIFYGGISVLWRIKIVKGKDIPAQIGPKLH